MAWGLPKHWDPEVESGSDELGVLGGLVEVRPAGLATAAFGFLPVTLIAASAFGVAGLRTLATHVLVPVLTAGAVALVARGRAIRLLAPAFVAGVVATLLYDSFRFGFRGFGLMHHDPIPNIGEALHLRPAWVAGSEPVGATVISGPVRRLRIVFGVSRLTTKASCSASTPRRVGRRGLSQLAPLPYS